MNRSLTAEETYRMANRLFPDDGDLASFNVIYEIRNGLLLPTDPADVPDGEAKLVGYVGYVDLGEEFWLMQALGQDGAAAEAIVQAMKDRILEYPLETEEEADVMPDIARDAPTAVAALGAWRTPDGTTRFVAYRHPDIPAHRAYALLREVLAEAASEETGAPAPTLGNN